MLLTVFSLVANGSPKTQLEADNQQLVSQVDNTNEFRSYDNEDIDPQTWRFVQLEKSESDGSISKIDLLRPTWWLDEYMADDGQTIHLDLPEIGMSGTYTVKAIKPCPPIKSSQDGTQPVIGKFTHQNAAVLDMVFEGESKPLGVTPNHPIWSETHQAYVSAGQFKVGEEVQTLHGTAKLLEVTQRPGRHTVYNLEVHKDHIYRIGDSGILVHNKSDVNMSMRYNGPKPKYHINDAHVPGRPGFHRGKTPLPSDAEIVFKKAIPDHPIAPNAWYGKNSQGTIYRYSYTTRYNGGAVHFSGKSGYGDGIRNVSKYAIERLKGM